MGQSLIAERHGRIPRLTLNRPPKRNAPDAELCASLELGLVHNIAQKPEEAALHLAGQPADSSPAAMRLGPQFVNQSRGTNLPEGLVIGRRLRAQVLAGEYFA